MAQVAVRAALSPALSPVVSLSTVESYASSDEMLTPSEAAKLAITNAPVSSANRPLRATQSTSQPSGLECAQTPTAMQAKGQCRPRPLPPTRATLAQMMAIKLTFGPCSTCAVHGKRYCSRHGDDF